MFGWFRKQPRILPAGVEPEVLPADAELALTAEAVYWVRCVVVVGRVECDELRLGDEVVAVGATPICRGRVTNLEQFNRVLDSARRGEQVGIMFSQWKRDSLPQDVRLFRVPARKQDQPAANN